MQAIHEAQAKQIAELMSACQAVIDSIGEEQMAMAVTSETTYQINAYSVCDMATALSVLRGSLKIVFSNSMITIPDSTYAKLLEARELYQLEISLERTEELYQFTQEQFEHAIAQLATVDTPEDPEIGDLVVELLLELRYYKEYG